jgi:hypothetical protein
MAVRATRAGVVFWVIAVVAVVTLVMRSLAGYGMMRKYDETGAALWMTLWMTPQFL